jgi:alpha-tubulin suppressor-like RCC1 family protein
MTSGGVRCLGENSNGQLGTGTDGHGGSDFGHPPSDTDVLTSVQSIAVGNYFSCALTITGGVRCWGFNYRGELGDGTTTDRKTPPATDTLTGIKAIGTGTSRMCAVRENGDLYCWPPSSSNSVVWAVSSRPKIQLVKRPIRPFPSTRAPSECLQSARLHGPIRCLV